MTQCDRVDGAAATLGVGEKQGGISYAQTLASTSGHGTLLFTEHGVKVMTRLWGRSRRLTVSTLSVRDQVFSGGSVLAGSYLSLAQVVKAKAMCVLEDVNVGSAVKPWVCKCI